VTATSIALPCCLFVPLARGSRGAAGATERRAAKRQAWEPARRLGDWAAMPRYFFHVDNGVIAPDEEGIDLPDHQSARMQSVQMLGEMLQDHAEEFWDDHSLKLIATDASGLIVFVLDLSGIEAPAFSKRVEPEPL
jgi:hypothetical protein